MAEQTFKSPGFFEREIEVISRPLTRNLATPVGVIGPAEKGPALVPTTVTSSEEFIRTFGSPDQNRSAAHAVVEFFENGGQAATFCRILGTGNSASNGNVSYAGFKIEGAQLAGNEATRAKGAVQFIVANHRVNPAEHVTLGILNDNDSITTTGDTDPSDNSGVLTNNTDLVQLVRAMIFMEKDHTLRVTQVSADANDEDTDDVAQTQENTGLFELRIVKAADSSVAKSYIVSLDPKDDQYISKVLNTDPFGFDDKLHFLYADFPVDDEIASTKTLNLNPGANGGQDSDVNDNAETIQVAVLRGKGVIPTYGDFSARYSSPRTTQFISQPFGTTEYPLFHIESLDDGAYASGQYKLSIADLRASTEKNNKYGTFTVQLRDLKDTDSNPIIYESYTRCTLDPNAKNFVARLIGDQKIKLSLDVDDEDEKRLVREGTFANKSRRIRVVMSDEVLRGEVPDEALPFGFRGIPALKTTSHGKDGQSSDLLANALTQGLDVGNILLPALDGDLSNRLPLAVLPPLPFRSKVTLGSMQKNGEFFQTYLGQSLVGEQKVTDENVSSSLYWGLMNTRVDDITKPNDIVGSSSYSRLTENLCKMLGADSSVQFDGASADAFNNNKFSLAKVAFPSSDTASISGSVQDAFLEAVYVRNADVGSSNAVYDAATHMINMHKTNDPFNDEDVNDTSKEDRATLAKLLVDDPVKFNRYNLMAKFTAPFYGGFDGVNILNRDDYFFTDRASSQDVGGHAAIGGYESGLVATDDSDSLKIMQGSLLNNNAVLSFRNAVKLMTDEMVVDHSVLVIPGIRESLITDYASRKVRQYGKAIYLMDIPYYTSVGTSGRIFVSSSGLATGRPDVDLTSSIFDSREVDSSYVATYFPDVMMIDRGDDENARLTNQRLVRVPSSVVALGAIARSDAATRSPWFAPAGFSRGALNSVRSTDVRLNAGDRDTLYEARINPIANFPNNQFVIFGQKTTQIARTSLDRVNVRRLMIYIKRKIQKIAQGLLFEQNDSVTRNRFIAATSEILQAVQIGQGIEDYRVIMDNSNNTDEDVDNNRLNGRIIVVPTRAVEFIAMDFVITNSGVEFP